MSQRATFHGMTKAERASALSRQRFWARLHYLGFRTYGEYLASEHWADVRRRFYASRLFKGRCHACSEARGLRLHHRTYVRLGKEHLGDLVALCDPCHKTVHRVEKRFHLPLKRATKRAIKAVWINRGTRPAKSGQWSKAEQRAHAKRGTLG